MINKNHPRRIHHAVIFLVLGIVGFTFISVIRFSFLNWDDPQYVLNNPLIRSLSFNNLKSIFTTKTYDVYSPLTILSFAFEYRFFQLNPGVYHFNNLLLHLAVVYCIFILGKQLGLSSWAAGVSALLFGIHPMHVQTVVWVTERKGVLYSFFYLLSVITYIQFLRHEKISLYLWSLLFGVLSLFAKPMALSLPIILCLCDWWERQNHRWRLFVLKIPYLLFFVPLVWITFAVNTDMYAHNIPVEQSMLIAMWSGTFYLLKFIWPVALAPVYELPWPVQWDNPAYSIAGITLFIGIAILFVFRKKRWLIWAGFFYIFNIFYFVRFDLVTKPDIVSDRYMYLASLGICMLVGKFIDRILNLQYKEKWKIYVGIAFLLCIISAGISKTKRYSYVWQNSNIFWNYVIATTERFEVAYHNRALLFIEEGDYERALDDLDQAIRIYPRYANAHFSRAVLAERLGNIQNALDDYLKSRELSPNDQRAYNNRANIFIRQRRFDDALKELNIFLETGAPQAEVLTNRALVYKRTGRIEEALIDLNEAIRLQPDLIQAYNNRGNIFKQKGEFQKALDDYNKGLMFDPNHHTLLQNKKDILTILDASN